MSSSGISFGGLASGLDTQAIIQALLSVERRPIAQLESRKQLFKSQKNLFGDLKTKLEDLAKAARDIRLSSTFVEFKVATDKEDYLTASASSNAAPGSYNVEVEQLAKAQVNGSLGKADRNSTTYGGGTLLFQVDGEIRDVAIPDTTLDGIASAINSRSTELGVRAQVVDTGDANNPFQLILTAAEAGSDNGFSVITDPSGGALEGLMNEVMGNTIVAADNAVLYVDGVRIERSSNSIADAIVGVTLDLVGADDDPLAHPTTRVTVTADGAATSAKVKSFVDKYNAIVDFVESQSVVDDEGNADSPLFGDSTLRSIRSSLRSMVGGIIDTGDNSLSMLSQVGIKSDTKGRLEFTQSKFEEALFENSNGVRNLFAQQDTGIANRLIDGLDLFTDSIDGMIKARTDGLDRKSKQVDESIERAERRLEQMEISLTNRFANLETLMNRLQGQGSAIPAGGFSTRR